MSDKARAALFNILGDLTGQIVLDVYAGSGAVGLEALSRGAKLAEGIEKLGASHRAIQKNVAELGVADQYNLVTAGVEDWLKWPINSPPQPRYNLITACPPYAKVQVEILEKLSEFLAPQGLLMVEHASKLESPKLGSVELIDHRTYGDSALSFYRSLK